MKQSEIERKFLVSSLPPGFLDKLPGEKIDQGYLILEAHTELRIRSRAGCCTMTLKQGSGLERSEEEKEIGQELFTMLWPLTAGRRVEKIRYVIYQSGFCLELDLFRGALTPLMLLEVEFETVADSHEYLPPDFVTMEVTHDRAYSNAMLASAGLPTAIDRYIDQKDEEA